MSFVLQDIKSYYKTEVINIEDRHIDHWLKIESPETDPFLSGYIIYNQDCTIEQMGLEEVVFLNQPCRVVWIFLSQLQRRGEKEET